ncbi:FAD/NAD(P)-binding domain-containing protein [Xylariomycetidae sp. FL0641]|nr:FAD/NAD(P)-binding domain-containing protein [Xylariomycetidae sp. FL0641]
MASEPKFNHEDCERLDVVIVGAGISGINCAYRIQSQLPHLKFTILENREDIGGTWDLFRYPGVRSDSDLHTYGFEWQRWPFPTPIAEGPLIKQYLWDCVTQHNLQQYLRFRHHVTSAEWSSKAREWTVAATHDGAGKVFTAQFLLLATGYYDYEEPLRATIPGLETFAGRVIHPQFWPADYDYRGQRLAVIGSGATAVTLLPSLARGGAAQVTMVQRTPTYIACVDNNNNHHHRNNHAGWGPSELARRWLPWRLYSACARAYRLLALHLLTLWLRAHPGRARALLRRATQARLPPGLPHDPHFAPPYAPWEQRLCVSPDGDFFAALHGHAARVVTGRIAAVDAAGLALRDGTRVDADALVTATGLRMRLGGGVRVALDGEPVAWAGRLLWNGSMLQDVPNLLVFLGYTNHSWTLGADATAILLCRLKRHMDARGLRAATPRVPAAGAGALQRMWQLCSTYANLAEPRLPKYGSRGPWKPKIHPPLDYVHARWGDYKTGLHFEI